MLGDWIDDYETGGSQTAEQSQSFWDSLNVDSSQSDMEFANYAEQSKQAAIQAVKDAAATGREVPAYTVDTLQSQGIDINSIASTGGALFKLVANAAGKFTAHPVNAAAQQQVASGASSNKLLMLGALAALAFAFLH